LSQGLQKEQLELLNTEPCLQLLCLLTFYWFFVMFTACTPVSLISPSPHICLHPFEPPLGKKRKKKKQRKKQKTFQHGSWSVLECVPQHSSLSTQLHLQMFTAKSHWSGLRSLASVTPSILDPYWDYSWLFCCCPVSWRSCSFGSLRLAHSQAVHRWSRCWGGPTQSPGSGSGW
jgi:hypothetical protein